MGNASFVRCAAVAAALAGAGCANFYSQLTPSGGRCADMPVVGYGKDELLAGRRFTRLRAVASSPKAATPAERVESLRREACDLRADAVVEVFKEDVVQPEARSVRLSGFAARFVGANP